MRQRPSGRSPDRGGGLSRKLTAPFSTISVENVRAYLRGNKLSNRVFGTHDAIVDACCDAWLWLTQQPDCITALGTRA